MDQTDRDTLAVGAPGEPGEIRAAGALGALSGAIGDVQGLFSGPGRFRRWRELAALAMLAGIVGVGIQPPPLGLLEPAWAAHDLRAALLQTLGPWALILLALAVLLLAAAACSRAFLLRFVDCCSRTGFAPSAPTTSGREASGLSPGRPGYVRPGLLHFAWSSALTLPLYLVLWGLEWRLAGEGYSRLLRVPDAEIAAVAVGLVLKFLAVLVPWAVVTLPAMVYLYELTPAGMVVEGGDLGRGRQRAAACIRAAPGQFVAYSLLRMLVQAVGTGLAALALLPGLALGLLVNLPGLVVTSLRPVTVPLTLLLIYALECALLVPVSALVYTMALRYVADDDRSAGFRASQGR
jgi:hypothetical protein